MRLLRLVEHQAFEVCLELLRDLSKIRGDFVSYKDSIDGDSVAYIWVILLRSFQNCSKLL